MPDKNSTTNPRGGEHMDLLEHLDIEQRIEDGLYRLGTVEQDLSALYNRQDWQENDIREVQDSIGFLTSYCYSLSQAIRRVRRNNRIICALTVLASALVNVVL